MEPHGTGGFQSGAFFSNSEFDRSAETTLVEIGAEVVDEVAEKVRRLGIGRRMSVRTALVYSGRLSPAVEAEGFFDVIVDAASLLSGEGESHP